jgi:hypothetical protein
VAKGPYIYEIRAASPGVESKIITNSKIGIADSSFTFLSVIRVYEPTNEQVFIPKITLIDKKTFTFLLGKVVDGRTKEPLLNTQINLINKMTFAKFAVTTTNQGIYSLKLPAGNYAFEISHLSYTGLKGDLKLKTNEIRNLSIEMNQAGSYITYELKSDKKLNKKQLNQRIKKLN